MKQFIQFDLDDQQAKEYFKRIFHEVLIEGKENPSKRRLVTTKELQELFKIKSNTTMVKYRSMGLPHIAGKPIRYWTDEVDNWLKFNAIR
jgi:hypothetical protein